MISATSVSSEKRALWMAVLAKAALADLYACWQQFDCIPRYRLLRKPETGLVMVRGRMGGDGAPFNFGEMTVTRCTVQLDDGVLGFAYIAGRNHHHAEMAAVADAWLQQAAHHEQVWRQLIEPLQQNAARQAQITQAATAQTKVDFFTMVRGEG